MYIKIMYYLNNKYDNKITTGCGERELIYKPIN